MNSSLAHSASASAKTRPAAPTRAGFLHFKPVSTRWSDNDAYRHVNNAIYYSYFDTAINELLVRAGELDFENGETIALAVETGCKYFASVSYPDALQIGVRVAHMGNSSVRYELGVFRNDEEVASALGHFVHVYVDRISQRPVPVPAGTRRLLEPLMACER